MSRIPDSVNHGVQILEIAQLFKAAILETVDDQALVLYALFSEQAADNGAVPNAHRVGVGDH